MVQEACGLMAAAAPTLVSPASWMAGRGRWPLRLSSSLKRRRAGLPSELANAHGAGESQRISTRDDSGEGAGKLVRRRVRCAVARKLVSPQRQQTTEDRGVSDGAQWTSASQAAQIMIFTPSSRGVGASRNRSSSAACAAQQSGGASLGAAAIDQFPRSFCVCLLHAVRKSGKSPHNFFRPHPYSCPWRSAHQVRPSQTL